MNSKLTTSEQRTDRHPVFCVGPQMYSNTEHEQDLLGPQFIQDRMDW